MSTQVRITRDNGTVATALTVRDALRIREGYGVYQLLDADGDLIYTGRTSQLAKRLGAHSKTQPFWPAVTYVAWTECDSYGQAVSLERMAISTSPTNANIAGRIDLDAKAARGRMDLPPAAARRLTETYALADDPAMSAAADSYMLALRDAGWTLQAIAAPLNITRERVRQRASAAARDLDLIVPAPPAKPSKRPAYRTWLWPAEQCEIDALAPVARKVNGSTPADDPSRAASERLSELFAELRLRNVTTQTIADAAGCTIPAVNLRLARHGYRKNPPSQAPYRGVQTQPTRTLRDVEQCFRGHDLTEPDAVRHINGDPKRPVCRQCDRIRVDKYQQKKRARPARAA